MCVGGGGGRRLNRAYFALLEVHLFSQKCPYSLVRSVISLVRISDLSMYLQITSCIDNLYC